MVIKGITPKDRERHLAATEQVTRVRAIRVAIADSLTARVEAMVEALPPAHRRARKQPGLIVPGLIVPNLIVSAGIRRSRNPRSRGNHIRTQKSSRSRRR